jgi:integrase
MGTIIERRRQDGTPTYTAQIRIRQNGKILFTEAQTFAKRPPAEKWLHQREKEIRRQLEDGIIGPPIPTLDEAILRFQESHPDQRSTGVLTRLMGGRWSQRRLNDLTTKDFGDLLKERLQVVQPQTVMNDLVYLRQLMITAKVEWGLDLDLAAIEQTKTYAHRAGWVCQSRRVERRMKPEERDALQRVIEQTPRQIPMADIIDFALASTRRVSEICRLCWSDLNVDAKTSVVRDLKHPRRKTGNHQTFRLTPEGLAIIQRQPRLPDEDRIFPYSPGVISTTFHHLTRMAGVKGLRFHDLRHEAISRLFERGYAIHEVALFSLHSNWDTLRRYTHLKPEDLPDR